MPIKKINKGEVFYKMKRAEVYIRKLGSRFYYFCMYDVEIDGKKYNKWMPLNFRPNLDIYHTIDKEPTQISIPFKHCRSSH